MCDTCRLPRRRSAFTLVELLVVMVLILVIFALGVGYVIFGQNNQHSVVGANAVTGAMLNAKQRARRDGVPTGIRILFTTSGNATFASQIQLVQQPTDYTAGQMNPVAAAQNTITFNPATVDFQGGAQYVGQIDESTVQAGDYFAAQDDNLTPHRINTVGAASITLDSAVSGALTAGHPYYIIRGPRRLMSEDVITLPPSTVIDNSVYPQPAGPNSIQLCQNLPQRTLVDSNNPNGVNVSEIVFAPSGAVIGQGTMADKILLWLRDPRQTTPLGAAPVIVSIQTRSGLIGVYPVAPWNPGAPISANNDPYRYAKDGRASGM